MEEDGLDDWGINRESQPDPDPRRQRCISWFNANATLHLPPFHVLPPEVGKALFKEKLDSCELELCFRFFVVMDLPLLWVWKIISIIDCLDYPGGSYGYRRRVIPLEWYFEFDKIKQQD